MVLETLVGALEVVSGSGVLEGDLSGRGDEDCLEIECQRDESWLAGWLMLWAGVELGPSLLSCREGKI